jgi:tetratricopeptide (TPR) repeat protein
MDRDDLDFEISFYERLLKERPNFVEALVAVGDVYTRKGLHEKGLEVDRRLVALRPDDPVVHYNLACDYSLLRDAEHCLEALDKALRLGYDDFTFMEKDPDLHYIRQDTRYQELLARYRRK